MHSRAHFGMMALLFGALSVPLAVFAQYADSLRNSFGGRFLAFVDRLGLVAPPNPRAKVEIGPSGLLSITDDRAIFVLASFSTYLSIVAMGVAIAAEAGDEDNLYLSAGFMCGASALVYTNFAVGIVIVLAGSVALLGVRRHRIRKLMAG